MKAELWYLFFGYLAVWLALFAYMLHLGRSQSRIEQELSVLRRLLDRR